MWIVMYAEGLPRYTVGVILQLICSDIEFGISIYLTLRLPISAQVPYSNSLDPDEMPSNLASHPDPSCLTLRQHFHQL